MSTEHLLGDVGLILEALMGTADDPRQEAERHLRGLTLQNSGDVLLLLAQIGAQGVGGFQLDQRLLALILLKRLAFTDLPGLFLNDNSQHATSPFDVVAERTKTRIETVLCAGLKDEMDSRMRRGLGTCVASWTQESSSRMRPCMSFPPVLLELSTSADPTFRFTPFQLLDLAPTLLVDSMRDPLPPPQLARMLLAGMSDPSVDVRVEALKAMRSVVMEGLTGREREQIGDGLVHQAFATLHQIPFNLLSHALGPLVDLSSTYPSLFHKSLTTILPYLLSLTSPPQVPYTQYSFSPYPPSSLDFEAYEEIANPATEILLSLSELRRLQVLDWEHGRAGKELLGLFTQRLVVALADQGEDSKDWLEADQLDEEDELYPSFSEEALDRLAMSLGGETILPALSHHVPLLLQESDWRCRYSALMAVASTAEGCVEEFQPRLQDILTLISPSAKDSHPRVRYAFLQCLGQLCQDLDGEVQKRFPKEVLDILLLLLSDPIARVRAHAGACMVNFFNDADISALSSLLDPIVKTLVNAFAQGPTYVQEQVFATLSSISSHSEVDYTPYYRQTLDLAISVLCTPPEDDRRRLVGRAMECATLTGLGIGKATFSGDAVKVAALLISIQNQVTSSDDPRTAYLFEAWASLCRSLGSDFKPFLPHVIPPLLQAAAYVPASDNSSQEGFASKKDDETLANGASVHTAEMDEKVLAFDNLNVYAYMMRSDFEPYLGQCMELSLGALTFSHSEDVREAAAFLIPALLQVAKESSAWKEASGPLQQVFQTVINAIAKEVDSGYLALLLKSFTDSIHVIGVALPHQLSSHLIRACNGHLTDLRARREDRLAQDEFMDEGDRQIYMEEQDEEGAALDHMSKALVMMTKYDHGVEVGRAVVELWQKIAQVKSMALGGAEGYE